jgi:ParB/RepB/Spo0J family partition protein
MARHATWCRAISFKKEYAMSDQKIVRIPIDQFEFDEQIRSHIDENEITKLALNCRTNGQLQPIRVRQRGDKFIPVYGYRRILALKKGGIDHADCVVADKELSEAEILLIQWSENAQRVDLNPIDHAKAVCRIMDETGMNGVETVKKLGISGAEVSRCRAMVFEWSEELRQFVQEGKICPSTGTKIHAEKSPERQREMIHRALKGELPRDLAEAMVRQSENAASAQVAAVSKITLSLDEGTIAINASSLASTVVVGMLSRVLSYARKLHAQGLADDAFLLEFRKFPKKARI